MQRVSPLGSAETSGSRPIPLPRRRDTIATFAITAAGALGLLLVFATAASAVEAYADTSLDSGRCAPATVTYVAKVTGAVGEVRYEWDFDNPGNYNAFQPDAFGQSVQRFYPEPGRYSASLHAMDSSQGPYPPNQSYSSANIDIRQAAPGDEPGPLTTNLPAQLSLPFRLTVRTVKRFVEASADPTTTPGSGVYVQPFGQPIREASGQYLHSFIIWAGPVGSTLSFYIRGSNPLVANGCYDVVTPTAMVAAATPCPAPTFQSGLTTRRTKRGVQVYPSVLGVFSGKCAVTFTARLITTVDGKRRVVTARRRAVPITQYNRNVVYPSRVIYLLYPKGKRRPNPVVSVDYQVGGGTMPFRLNRQTKTIG